MSDLVARLGALPAARRLIRGLRLPLPLPYPLRRQHGPWRARPLEGCAVAVGAAPGGALGPALARTLVLAGASPHLATGVDLPPFRDLGEAYGRPPVALEVAAELRARALVFDATGVADAAALEALYAFFHPLLPRLEASGRVVILGRPPASATTAVQAAARAALDGFTRSLAKEVGRRGATASLLQVQESPQPHGGGGGGDVRENSDAAACVEPVLRFLLSDAAAFVTGQTILVGASVPAASNGSHWVRPLDGKVALVTGAARGIGEATARCLAREGARVVCLDLPGEDARAAALAQAIAGEVLSVDLGDDNAPAVVAQHLRARHGGVDVVVHNAGVTRDRTLARMPPELWRTVIDVNLSAMARLDAALDAAALLRPGARVVALSSVTGIAGNVGQTNYAASKAGVLGYVRQRAQLLAARGITVNAVAPGFIETRLTAAMPVLVREAGRRLSALGQGGLPSDVAEVIAFLATPAAAGVTGAALRVCGGALVGA